MYLSEVRKVPRKTLEHKMNDLDLNDCGTTAEEDLNALMSELEQDPDCQSLTEAWNNNRSKIQADSKLRNRFQKLWNDNNCSPAILGSVLKDGEV